jgi:hypothetical protein
MGTERTVTNSLPYIQLLSYVEIKGVSNGTLRRNVSSTHNGMQPIKYIKLHTGLIK